MGQKTGQTQGLMLCAKDPGPKGGCWAARGSGLGPASVFSSPNGLPLLPPGSQDFVQESSKSCEAKVLRKMGSELPADVYLPGKGPQSM